jgi:hypothetical protein
MVEAVVAVEVDTLAVAVEVVDTMVEVDTMVVEVVVEEGFEYYTAFALVPARLHYFRVLVCKYKKYPHLVQLQCNYHFLIYLS